MTELNPYRKEAYWISPSGDVLKVHTTHIAEIIDKPQIFGLKTEAIKKLCNEFNEPLGFEGKARGKIMTELIQNRWIRIRWTPKRYSYTVQMIKNEIVEKNLETWLNTFTKKPDLNILWIE